MSKDDKAVIIIYIITMIYNIIEISLFIFLAIQFKNWWLALFSVAFCRFPQITSKGNKDE